MKVERHEEIPLAKITIGKSQARAREVDKNLGDLVLSIKTLGLLEPIVVTPPDDAGNYEVVTGQRRFLAVSQLGWEKIQAGILSERPAEDIAKAISVTENLVREDMSDRDYIDACTALFRRYGSIKAVSEETGLPAHRVREYVKFDQLTADLKKKVESEGLPMQTALRAQAAATKNGEIDEKMALALAEEMKGMAGAQQRQLEKLVQKKPDASVDEIIEAGRKQPKVRQIIVIVSEEVDEALSAFANEQGTTNPDAAANLITDGLSSRGYMGDAEAND